MEEAELKYPKEREKIKKLNDLRKLDCKIRGHFLVQTINIEWLIADILTAHFASFKDKHNQLFSYVIQPEIWLKKKIELFKKILDTYYPELSKKYPDLISNLEDINNFRNRIAHSNLDYTDDFINKNYTDRVQYIYYKDGGLKKQMIKKDEFHKKLVICSQTIKQLLQIQYNVRKTNLKD